jgi:hypothetical protein
MDLVPRRGAVPRGVQDARTAYALPPEEVTALREPREVSVAAQGSAPVRPRATAKRAIILAGIVYALLALLAYRPILPFDNSRLPTCTCADLIQDVWFLRWTSFALLHGHNPFLTNYMNFPSGVNLAQNTSTPLLGIVAAPITWAFGPVAGLNAVMWLAYPVSAAACFVTLRRWVTWMPAAFVGGLLYGFSPYMVAQGASHPDLFFVPIPPLILLVLDELVVRQSRDSRRVGIGLGLLAAAQYMISTEIFASSLMIGGFGDLVLMLVHPREIRTRARHALDGLGWGILVCGAIIGYPVYVALHGPNHLADLGAHLSSISSDLLSSVIPDASQRFVPSTWVRLGNQLALGNLAENDGYLGIPLLVLLAAAVARYRRHGVIVFAAIMMLLAEILSFGPRLTVDTHTTSVPLLMAALDRLPIVDSFVDSRLALYVNLFAAVILAISIDQLRSELRNRAVEKQSLVGRHQRRTPIRWPGFAMVAILTLALIPLVPRWPNRSYSASLPGYFSTTAFEQVPQGSVALTYPYPDYPTLPSMLWQAGTALRFRIIGGYALAPGANSQSIFRLYPSFLPSVPMTLVDDYIRGSLTPTKATPAQVRAFLVHYGVQTVFSESVGAEPKAADALFAAALGSPSTKDGRMEVWYNVAMRLAGSHSS